LDIQQINFLDSRDGADHPGPFDQLNLTTILLLLFPESFFDLNDFKPDFPLSFSREKHLPTLVLTLRPDRQLHIVLTKSFSHAKKNKNYNLNF
jgi:hypothetical protein